MSELRGIRQRMCDFIAAYTAEHHYPPTVREIGQAVGLSSSSSVHNQLMSLAAEGYVRWEPTKPRTITLVEGAA